MKSGAGMTGAATTSGVKIGARPSRSKARAVSIAARATGGKATAARRKGAPAIEAGPAGRNARLQCRMNRLKAGGWITPN